MLILQAPFHWVSLLCKPDGCRARPVSRHWEDEYTCQVARCNTHSIWKPAPRGSCSQFLGIILQGAEEIIKWSNQVLFFSPFPLWYPTPPQTQQWSVPPGVKEVALFILVSQLIALFPYGDGLYGLFWTGWGDAKLEEMLLSTSNLLKTFFLQYKS